MNEMCQSICSDDLAVRCAFPKAHGLLSIIDEAYPEAFIECAHANPAKGSYWSNGIEANKAVMLELSGDEYDALVTVLEDSLFARELLKAIHSKS